MDGNPYPSHESYSSHSFNPLYSVFYFVISFCSLFYKHAAALSREKAAKKQKKLNNVGCDVLLCEVLATKNENSTIF